MNGWKRSLPNTSHVARREKCDACMSLGAKNETSIIVVNVNVVRRPDKKSWICTKNKMASKFLYMIMFKYYKSIFKIQFLLKTDPSNLFDSENSLSWSITNVVIKTIGTIRAIVQYLSSWNVLNLKK